MRYLPRNWKSIDLSVKSNAKGKRIPADRRHHCIWWGHEEYNLVVPAVAAAIISQQPSLARGNRKTESKSGKIDDTLRLLLLASSPGSQAMKLTLLHFPPFVHFFGDHIAPRIATPAWTIPNNSNFLYSTDIRAATSASSVVAYGFSSSKCQLSEETQQRGKLRLDKWHIGRAYVSTEHSWVQI